METNGNGRMKHGLGDESGSQVHVSLDRGYEVVDSQINTRFDTFSTNARYTTYESTPYMSYVTFGSLSSLGQRDSCLSLTLLDKNFESPIY